MEQHILLLQTQMESQRQAFLLASISNNPTTTLPLPTPNVAAPLRTPPTFTANLGAEHQPPSAATSSHRGRSTHHPHSRTWVREKPAGVTTHPTPVEHSVTASSSCTVTNKGRDKRKQPADEPAADCPADERTRGNHHVEGAHNGRRNCAIQQPDEQGKRLDGIHVTDSPLSLVVRQEPIPQNLKIPKKRYAGITGPREHLTDFQLNMDLQNISDSARCRVFPCTLEGLAQSWYSRQKPNSFVNFTQLSEAFLGNFHSQKRQVKTSASLTMIRQQEGELLRPFVERFNLAALEIENLSFDATLEAFRN